MIDLLRIIYVLCAGFLGLYTLGQFSLLLLYFKHRNENTPAPEINDYPAVVVQLPIYNEQHVALRLIQAVTKLDYPKDKLEIQVLDDSTDKTVELIRAFVTELQQRGINIQHVRRQARTGYKAGALDYGLKRTSAEFVVLFDADFVPEADFLKRTIPYFVDHPELGIVQTRWGHLNDTANILTRAQALSIDTHFLIEQTARNRAGLLLTFNGTGGIWRAECIRDAGGWSDDTLTEDLDLSYRAQLKGWKYLFLPDIVVRGEVPPQITAYKRQQARWAKGNNQALVKLLLPVWQGKTSFTQRIMAMQHLCQYLPQPMMLILLLLTPPLLYFNALEGIPLEPLGIIGLAPPLMILIGQWLLYRDWYKRMLFFPAVMILGTGLVWNNSRAAIEAYMSKFTGDVGEFKRTPKFSNAINQSNYAIFSDWTLLIEISLALYAFVGVVLAFHQNIALVPYLGLYAVSLTMIVLWELRDRYLHWQTRINAKTLHKITSKRMKEHNLH